MMMKKLLLLGGSAQQVVAIETAKRLGYYTVLCDYLPDNPGQYVADRFYLVSTTDMVIYVLFSWILHLESFSYLLGMVGPLLKKL